MSIVYLDIYYNNCLHLDEKILVNLEVLIHGEVTIIRRKKDITVDKNEIITLIVLA